MKNLYDILSKSIIFKDISTDEISILLKSLQKNAVLSFSKDQIIAFEGDECSSLGIVLEGVAEIQRIYASGKTVTMSQLVSGDIFGEVIVFSEMHKYPATIVSTTNTKIFFISKEDIINICSHNSTFLNNFMGLLSKKILILNKKIKELSYQTIRQKLASYILDEYKKQKKLSLSISLSRKELSEHLGVPRPSISRELINMRDEGLIFFERNIIKIENLEELEDCLYT